jgi:hypothetical protein
MKVLMLDRRAWVFLLDRLVTWARGRCSKSPGDMSKRCCSVDDAPLRGVRVCLASGAAASCKKRPLSSRNCCGRCHVRCSNAGGLLAGLQA